MARARPSASERWRPGSGRPPDLSSTGLTYRENAPCRRSLRMSRPSRRVSRPLRMAPAAAPVSSGPSENALRPARAASRLRSSRASGDPAATTTPPGIMYTPRRCAHDATYAPIRSAKFPEAGLPYASCSSAMSLISIPDQDQGLRRDLGGVGGQHRQCGPHAHHSAGRGRGTSRALDERVGDLLGRPAAELLAAAPPGPAPAAAAPSRSPAWSASRFPSQPCVAPRPPGATPPACRGPRPARQSPRP